MSSFQQNVIKYKVGLLSLAAELGNVSRACKVMGFSRDTFYRYQSAMESGGIDALIDANHKKPKPKNRVEEAVELAAKNWGQTRILLPGSRIMAVRSFSSWHRVVAGMVRWTWPYEFVALSAQSP